MIFYFWRNLTWLLEEMKIQTNMHNDDGIYCRESTRSTTRHPCSRTLKSSTTGSKIESLLSCIGCWIRVRDDDRWMQMEISAFFSFFLSSFVIFLYGEIFMGWHWSRWNDVDFSCWRRMFDRMFLFRGEERKCYEVRYDLLISWVGKGANFSS